MTNLCRCPQGRSCSGLRHPTYQRQRVEKKPDDPVLGIGTSKEHEPFAHDPACACHLVQDPSLTGHLCNCLHGLAVDVIDFEAPDKFPAAVPFLSKGPFASRVLADYLAVLDDDYVFFVAHGGGAVELHVGGEKMLGKRKTQAKELLSVTKTIPLKVGKYSLDLIYCTPDPTTAQLILGINLHGGIQAVPNSFLSHESNIVLPTLHKISPEKSTLAGGGQIEIEGAGFTSDSEVFVGPYQAIDVFVKSADLIEVRVPSADAPADVLVQVKTSLGTSNPTHFSYNRAALMPVKFKETYLKKKDGSNFPSE